MYRHPVPGSVFSCVSGKPTGAQFSLDTGTGREDAERQWANVYLHFVGGGQKTRVHSSSMDGFRMGPSGVIKMKLLRKGALW